MGCSTITRIQRARSLAIDDSPSSLAIGSFRRQPAGRGGGGADAGADAAADAGADARADAG